MEETRPIIEEPEKVPVTEPEPVPVPVPVAEPVAEPIKEVPTPAPVVQEGLRQRKPCSAVSTDKNTNTVQVSSGKRTERYIVAIADKIPEKARPYVVKAAPVVGLAVDFGESMIPHLIALYKK